MSTPTTNRRTSLDLAESSLVGGGELKRRILRFRAASNNVARDRGIIDPAGWETEEYERSHPVFLWSHNTEIPPLGKAVRVEKRADGLVLDIEFMDDPFSDLIYRQYLFGSLRAVSVGFRVLEERMPTKEEAERGATWIASRCLLLELSAVSVPSDVSAVMLGARKQEATETFSKKDLVLMRAQFGSIQGWEPIISSLEAVLSEPEASPSNTAPVAASSTSPATETRAGETTVTLAHLQDSLLRCEDLLQEVAGLLAEMQPHADAPRSERNSEERKVAQEPPAPAAVDGVSAEALDAPSDGRDERLLELLKKHYPNG